MSEEQIQAIEEQVPGGRSRRSEDDPEPDHRADREGPQAIRAALPRACLGREGHRRDLTCARGHVPRDWPGPRRPDAAAGRSVPARSSRSRSIAISRPHSPRAVPANVEVITADVLALDLVPLAAIARRWWADARRRQPALQHLDARSCSRCSRRAPGASRDRRDVHAPARGRGRVCGSIRARRLRRARPSVARSLARVRRC